MNRALALYGHRTPDHGLRGDRRIGGLRGEFADQAVGVGIYWGLKQTSISSARNHLLTPNGSGACRSTIAITYAISLSAIRRRCCHRLSKPLRVYTTVFQAI